MIQNLLEEIEVTGKKKSGTDSLINSMRKTCKKIAPVWPLENFVAVNPYMGLTDHSFENAARQLSAAGNAKMTLPLSFYMKKLEEGEIFQEDIARILDKKAITLSVDDFIINLKATEDINYSTTAFTVADIASEVSKIDWNRFIVSRISFWAASYFDQGQAGWAAADKNSNLFLSWKAEAEVDRTPEITGLKHFRKQVKSLPDNFLEAAQKSLEILGISEEEKSAYFHRLLLRFGGWSAHAARLDWDSELYGGKDGKLIEFLAVLLSWEACLLTCLNNSNLTDEWISIKSKFAEEGLQKITDSQLEQRLILQEAFDLAAQYHLITKIENDNNNKEDLAIKTKAQAVFCIDVRSEIYRRNLEIVDRQIETFGFAGFFAFPINYIPLGHQQGEAQCPVLLKTGPTILEEIPDKKKNESAIKNRLFSGQVQQVWKNYKSGAISCFSFVSPLGLSYLPKLFTDSFGITRPVKDPAKVGLSNKISEEKSISLESRTHNNEVVGIPVEQRVQMAKNALTAMSLTENFADFVLFVGHGSTSVNNPHATGLDCGACGGRSGESNSKVAAAVLNDIIVRESLKKYGINIPDKTIFLACLHNTTTDEVSILNATEVPEAREKELKELKNSLNLAGKASRFERSMRMSTKGDIDVAIKSRSNDWSQVRPEWGLAGCSAFIVAPRKRTSNIDLEGRSFLHTYDWKKDKDFSVLELIMTAPMVVTSWINLQYYASTVDNKIYGSGNKTLHNVTAGIGVLEGFSGDLRVGLPIQSVHDGENYQHEPLRLSVIIEAPVEAMNDILKKHKSVRDLVDNNWIYLFSRDDNGKVSYRYDSDLMWEKI